MTLRNKSLIIVGATFFGLIISILVASWTILHHNLIKTEEQQVQQEVHRSALAFQNELENLDAILREYVLWDDTYAFVVDRNAAYIRSNMTSTLFTGPRLAAVVFLNSAGRIVYGSGFDFVAERQRSLPPGLQEFLKPGSLLTTHKNIKSTLRGVITLPDGVLMFASRPILTSLGQGPSRGTMIMGRFFTGQEIERLSRLIRQNLSFYKPDDHRDLTSDISQALLSSGAKDRIFVKSLSRDTAAGYQVIRDAYGQPALVMKVEVSRVLFHQGEKTLFFLIVSIFLIGIAAGILVLLMLEKTVLGRLQKMSEEVNCISASGSLMHIFAAGSDELSGLARNINGMIDTIEKSRDEIQMESDRYRAVVEDQTEFICRFGLKGNLIFANEALGRYLNQSPESLMGRSFFEIFPWEKTEEIRHEFTGIDGKYPVITFDAKMIFPDQELKWSRWTIRAIMTDHGLIKEYQAVGRDITERVQAETKQKSMEDQFFQAQKMEAIGTLAGGIAHDFNNILMGIGGYVSLMLYDIGEVHPHYKKLKAIEQQVRSAALLTRDLLGFARGGAYEIKPTDLNQILERTSALFGRTRKEIEIRHRFEENLWTVEADRSQMEQVFLNLFVNAAQAMPAGGNLYLETKNVTVWEIQGGFMKIQPGPYVQVSVTDEGVGMDEETKERVFEPFFTTKDREKRGSGLGLASVYGIVKNHGGTINVYTEKGVGTTFRIYLSAVNPVVIPKEESDRESQQVLRGTEGILVVEDEDLLMDVTVKMLSILGYRIFPAKSGAEALETYLNNRDQIDLVMLDMIMPGMSGEETFRKLKEIHPDVKVILASGYSMNEQATRIMENGCHAFLQKPYNTSDLSRTVRDVLDQLF
jgi:two-component system, cell cycle sensor histidine kinase and response regulator CckA